MKKTWFVFMVAALLTTMVEARPLEDFPTVKQILPLSGLTSDRVTELFSGEYSDIAILCEEGTELPVKYLCRSDIFSVKYMPNLTVKVEKTCYFRPVGKKVYMSYDLKNWVKPEKIFGGSQKVAAGVAEDQSHIGIEVTFLPQSEDESDDD